MKFGKQLQLGMYEPWTEYYIAYGRLKRLIERTRFNADKSKDPSKLSKNNSFGSEAGLQHVGITESSPLVAKHPSPSLYNSAESSKAEDGYTDEFFPVLEDDLARINKFYVGKMAELKLSYDLIVVKRDNWYQSHHTGNKPSDLYNIRDMYIECKALLSYQKLNRTGFVKIVKKYDKIMHETNLPEWISKLSAAPFAVSTDAEVLFTSIEGLVSRGILVEWERYAAETIGKPTDVVFPAVHGQSLLACLGIFFVTYMIPWRFGDGDPAAGRCLALLVFVVAMWVSKAIPYFATALMIPVLVTVLGVLKDSHGHILEPEEASTLVLSSMTNHTTFLLLGGYTISSAFARCELEQDIASWLQQKLGHSPRLFILAVMFLGLFLSMWISNHTAPILCTAILTPIIQDLPHKCRFTKGLLLGLAFACNFGGMTTPISSMQNALAVGQLEEVGISVAFGHWLLVSVPFCSLGVLLSWVVLLVCVRPDDVDAIPAVVYKLKGSAEMTEKRNIAVVAFCTVIVFLLASSQLWKPFVGDIGILSLSFLVLMFGSGILTEVDFNSLSWHTLFLLGGGNVLGMAISSSKLLTYLANMIISKLPYDDPWVTLIIVLCFCTVVATFVSHTVASLILMPIITEVGLQLDTPRTFVIGAAFAVSGGMGLPFSSFPNVNSMLVVDDFQKPYVSTRDFILSGGILSAVTVLLISTLGYSLIFYLL